MDLNIPIGPNCQDVCATAIAYGYKILALNTPVLAKDCCSEPGGARKGVGKKRKWEERSGGIITSTAVSIGKTQVGVPVPSSPDWKTALLSENPGVRILNRLTIIFSDISELQKALNLPNTKLYDVLAVLPSNNDSLQGCIVSTSLTFDIISFDLEGPHWIKTLKMNKLKGNSAARRDVFFEVTYASAMHGDSALENMVYLANRLTEDICVKKVKNMIISSGAARSLELRSPKDSSSLAFLFGLDETSARQCIQEHPLRVVDKSDARVYGKTWVAFIPRSQQQDSPKKNVI